MQLVQDLELHIMSAQSHPGQVLQKESCPSEICVLGVTKASMSVGFCQGGILITQAVAVQVSLLGRDLCSRKEKSSQKGTKRVTRSILSGLW